MGQNSSILKGAFAAGNALQNPKPSIERFERLDGHEVSGGFAVLGDEDSFSIGFKVGDDFGSLAFECGDEFSSH